MTTQNASGMLPVMATATNTSVNRARFNEAKVRNFCALIRESVDTFYKDGDFGAFNARNRSLWDEIQAAGLRDQVAYALRPA